MQMEYVSCYSTLDKADAMVKSLGRHRDGAPFIVSEAHNLQSMRTTSGSSLIFLCVFHLCSPVSSTSTNFWY